MRRTRNAKGHLGNPPREIELPADSSVPAGWEPSDTVAQWETPEPVEFDPSHRGQRMSRPPLRGAAAVTMILRFFNLEALDQQGRLQETQAQERDRLRNELREVGTPRGHRGWMRVPVQVDVLLGARKSAARMSDIGAGGVRLDNVAGRFMVGTRVDVAMGFGLGDRRGMVIFPTRVAWVNEMRRTMGMEFTDAPRWRSAP